MQGNSNGFGDDTRLLADVDDSETTGLPWPRSWSSVYLLVMGCFLMWVILLWALEKVFHEPA